MFVLPGYRLAFAEEFTIDYFDESSKGGGSGFEVIPRKPYLEGDGVELLKFVMLEI